MRIDMEGGDIEARLARLESHRDICNLQGRYNHYLQTGQLKEKLGELFAFGHPGLQAEMADSGLWRGDDGVRTLFAHLGAKYAMPGALMVHLLTTPVLEVDAGNASARGMWNSLGTNTYLDDAGALVAMWQLGKYDIGYRRSAGRWQIVDFRWHVVFRTPFHEGWVRRPLVEGLQQPGFPPAGERHRPYDPAAAVNVFAPFPPEPADAAPAC